MKRAPWNFHYAGKNFLIFIALYLVALSPTSFVSFDHVWVALAATGSALLLAWAAAKSEPWRPPILYAAIAALALSVVTLFASDMSVQEREPGAILIMFLFLGLGVGVFLEKPPLDSDEA